MICLVSPSILSTFINSGGGGRGSRVRGWQTSQSSVYCRASTERLTTIYTYCQFRITNDFELWEEAGVPADRAWRHRENFQTPCRRVPVHHWIQTQTHHIRVTVLTTGALCHSYCRPSVTGCLLEKATTGHVMTQFLWKSCRSSPISVCQFILRNVAT